MTRVLQLRRGSAEQNNNFTGLPGEITVDMDAKTLRIHDGETLGGFALRRADDAATDTGTFDPGALSDDFWSDLIAKHTPAPFTITETTAVPVNSGTAHVNYVFGGEKMPHFVRAALVCRNDEAGYITGDVVWAFGIGEYDCPCINCFVDKNGLNIRLMVGGQKYWACHRDTGTKTELTDANWDILFHVYC